MNGYITLQNDLFKSDMNVHEIVTYAVLKAFSNCENNCFPSRKTIAEKCGLSLTTIKITLKSLYEKGFIEKCGQFRKNGSQTSNLYTIKSISENNKYFRVDRDIFEMGLTEKAVAVYLFLSCSADNEGIAFPSKSVIANNCDISVSSVNIAVKELKAVNLIDITAQIRQNGGCTSNVYTLIKQELQPDESNIKIPKNDPSVLYDPHPLFYTPTPYVFNALLELNPMLNITHKQVFNKLIQDKKIELKNSS